jgi:uncharacterized integral membrane protein
MSPEEPKPPVTQEHPPWLTRQNIKLAVWIVFLVSAVIIIVQNWGDTTLQLLFFKDVKAPQSLLLILMMVIGFLLGLTVRFGRHPKK